MANKLFFCLGGSCIFIIILIGRIQMAKSVKILTAGSVYCRAPGLRQWPLAFGFVIDSHANAGGTHCSIEVTVAAMLCSKQNHSNPQHILDMVRDEVIRMRNSSREDLVNPKDMK